MHPWAASAAAAAESAGGAGWAAPRPQGWDAPSSERRQPPCGGVPAAVRVCTRPRT